jgi:hypothetical protein
VFRKVEHGGGLCHQLVQHHVRRDNGLAPVTRTVDQRFGTDVQNRLGNDPSSRQSLVQSNVGMKNEIKDGKQAELNKKGEE